MPDRSLAEVGGTTPAARRATSSFAGVALVLTRSLKPEGAKPGFRRLTCTSEGQAHRGARAREERAQVQAQRPRRVYASVGGGIAQALR